MTALRCRSSSLLVFVAASAPDASWARTPLPEAFESAPTISVLTVAPGDTFLVRFGHTALRVEDEAGGSDLVYDYGSFEYDPDSAAVDFLRGGFEYHLLPAPLERTLERYADQGRSVIEQVLNLSPWEALALERALVENAKLENRYYDYDYFRDNCTTRVRDLLDTALSGKLRRAWAEPVPHTIRHTTLASLRGDLGTQLFLDVALNGSVDGRLEQWSAAFLPHDFSLALEHTTLPGRGPARALVATSRVLLDCPRASSGRRERNCTSRLMEERADVAPSRLGSLAPGGKPERPHLRRWLPALGAPLGALFIAAGWRNRTTSNAGLLRAVLVCAAIVGLGAGSIGSLLVLLWWFTPHAVAAANHNILEFPPWALALGATLFLLRSPTTRQLRMVRVLAASCLAAAAAGALLSVFSISKQSNSGFIALMLPLWLGLSLALEIATGVKRT